MSKRIEVGRRRFTCLAPGLVRMEFAPYGNFETRRSIAAYEQQRPRPFESVTEEGGWTQLDTGMMTVRTRENEKAFFPGNLEVRWRAKGLLQYWRAGDRDYRNLGGTVHSLDRYGRTARLEGVHTADALPNDRKGNSWLAWVQCEEDPWYYEQSEVKHGGRGDLHTDARRPQSHVLERMRNVVLDGSEYSPGVLSRSGYFLLNDSESPLMDEDDFPTERNRPGYQDWYFFCYGEDYKQALADWILLTGRAPLPTKNVFGLIFSRWPAYDETEAREIIAQFNDEGIPLSTLVLDMEWHKEGWANWDWDEKMYPDPKAFFDWLHGQGMEVTLNVHPLRIREDDSHFRHFVETVGGEDRITDGEYNKKPFRKIDINICDKEQAPAFMRVCHDEFVDIGLDYWWVDGTRGRMNGVDDQLVGSKLYWENVATDQKRGMLLSRYGGVGTHRYGVFFTGDTASCWNILKMQCEFNIRAGHLGLAYVSHDIGGFFSPAKTPLVHPELFVRWVQFGAFNPVFRFHSAPGSGSREPWDYGEAYGGIARHWLQVRHSLLPYLYSAARAHYETGVPIVRGLFLEAPNDEECYRFDEFYFGESILVAPMLDPVDYREMYLPRGRWFELDGTAPVDGGRVHRRRVGQSQIPVFVRSGSILLRQTQEVLPSASHIDELVLDIYPGATATATLYEDDGKSPAYKEGGFCKTRFDMDQSPERTVVKGCLVEGHPLGEKRTLMVDLPLIDHPDTVTLNGKQLGKDCCRETKHKGRFRISAGEIRTDEEFELVIEAATANL